MEQTNLGIVLVAYGHGQSIKPLLDTIKKEKKSGDRVVLIDNHQDRQTASIADKHPIVDVTIRSENVGFAGGCVKAAAAIEDEVGLLLFLNPDSQPEAGAITKLRSRGRKDWGAWMGLLVLGDGKKVNSAGNVVHISGLSWVTGFGDDPQKYTELKEVSVVSGADFIIRAKIWKKLGGFPEFYFMYYEDTDISFGVRMLGYKLGLVPDARIRHDYNFYNSPHKWLYIERNRYLFIIRNWPLGVIAVLLPLLLLVELGLWLISILQRRFKLKVRSSIMALVATPEALRGRREVLAQSKLSSYEFLQMLQPQIDTPLLSPLIRSWPVNGFFRAYYWLAKKLLSAFS